MFDIIEIININYFLLFTKYKKIIYAKTNKKISQKHLEKNYYFKNSQLNVFRIAITWLLYIFQSMIQFDLSEVLLGCIRRHQIKDSLSCTFIHFILKQLEQFFGKFLLGLSVQDKKFTE